MTKLTYKQHHQIVSMWRNGYTVRTISKIMNTDISLIKQHVATHKSVNKFYDENNEIEEVN